MTTARRGQLPIQPVSDEDASPEVSRIFAAMSGAGTPVTPFFRMLAHKPAMLRAYNQLAGALWSPDSRLSAKLKDLAYMRASILDGCEY